MIATFDKSANTGQSTCYSVGLALLALHGEPAQTLPIAGETLGAGALVIATQSPAGESESDLAKTRVIDAANHQRLESVAHPDAGKAHNTTFPGHGGTDGPHHTTLPANFRSAKEGILAAPSETQAEPAPTGHASPNLRELTTDRNDDRSAECCRSATLAKQEKPVKPEHAAHLTPSGTLVNADRAIVDVERKINGYALNPQHPEGNHKARVFKSALGCDMHNLQGLVD